MLSPNPLAGEPYELFGLCPPGGARGGSPGKKAVPPVRGGVRRALRACLQTLAQTAQQGQQVHRLRLQHMALSPIQLQQAVEHGRHALGGLIHGLEEAARFLQVFGTGTGGLQQLGNQRIESQQMAQRRPQIMRDGMHPLLLGRAQGGQFGLAPGQQRQRCRTTTVQQEVAQGYEVTYEYRGRRFTTELPYDPGPTVVVQPPRATQQYSSQPNHETVHPGRKSYGSAPVAGRTESIEYRSPQPDIPIVLDLRTAPITVPGTTPAPRPKH